MPITPFTGYDLSGWGAFSQGAQDLSRSLRMLKTRDYVQERLNRYRDEAAKGRITGYEPETTERYIPSIIDRILGKRLTAEEAKERALQETGGLPPIRKFKEETIQRPIREIPEGQKPTREQIAGYQQEAISDIQAYMSGLPREEQIDAWKIFRQTGLTFPERMKLRKAAPAKPYKYYITTKEGEEIMFKEQSFPGAPSYVPPITNRALKEFGLTKGDINLRESIGWTPGDETPAEREARRASAKARRAAAAKNATLIIGDFVNPKYTFEEQKAKRGAVEEVLPKGQRIVEKDPAKGKGFGWRLYYKLVGEGKRLVIVDKYGLPTAENFGKTAEQRSLSGEEQEFERLFE